MCTAFSIIRSLTSTSWQTAYSASIDKINWFVYSFYRYACTCTQKCTCTCTCMLAIVSADTSCVQHVCMSHLTRLQATRLNFTRLHVIRLHFTCMQVTRLLSGPNITDCSAELMILDENKTFIDKHPIPHYTCRSLNLYKQAHSDNWSALIMYVVRYLLPVD